MQKELFWRKVKQPLNKEAPKTKLADETNPLPGVEDEVNNSPNLTTIHIYTIQALDFYLLNVHMAQ